MKNTQMKKVSDINKERLNIFLAKQKHSPFLQSYEWGALLEEEGNEVIRFGFEEDGRLFFAVSIVKKSLPLGMSYFYAPRINIKDLTQEQTDFIFKSIAELVKKKKAIFFRFEPSYRLPPTAYRLNKTIDIQPSKTLILDLGRSEEELLQDMHQKTRYNIRLAEKKGVVIREGKGERDFEEFWKIMKETKTRDDFRLHGKGHYRNILLSDKFSNDFLKIKLFLAEYEGKVISGNIVSFFGDTAVYMHGASSNMHRNVMAPYFLQWKIIRAAKKAGYKYYDFYGVDEHKWPGVTRFKLGFGGKRVEYPGTFDLVYDNLKYNIYGILRKLRRYI